MLFVLHRCFLRRTERSFDVSVLSMLLSVALKCMQSEKQVLAEEALLLQDAGEQQGTAGAFAAFTATHSSDRNYPRASLT